MSKMPRYFNLSIGAPARLSALREQAAKRNGTDWRAVRSWGFHNWRAAYGDIAPGFNGTNERNRVPVWYAHTGEQFRRERFADECSDAPRHVRDCQGYYTDSDASETARGIVARLPHGRFLAGYYWSSNGERVYFADVFDDESDAARAADSHAETFAETAREDSYQWDAARDIEREIEEQEERVRECLALRNNARFPGAREEARACLATIREKRETLKTDYADYC